MRPLKYRSDGYPVENAYQIVARGTADGWADEAGTFVKVICKVFDDDVPLSAALNLLREKLPALAFHWSSTSRNLEFSKFVSCNANAITVETRVVEPGPWTANIALTTADDPDTCREMPSEPNPPPSPPKIPEPTEEAQRLTAVGREALRPLDAIFCEMMEAACGSCPARALEMLGAFEERLAALGEVARDLRQECERMAQALPAEVQREAHRQIIARRYL